MSEGREKAIAVLVEAMRDGKNGPGAFGTMQHYASAVLDAVDELRTPPAPPAPASVEAYHQAIEDSLVALDPASRKCLAILMPRLRAIPLPEQPSVDVEAWREGGKAIAYEALTQVREADDDFDEIDWYEALLDRLTPTVALPARGEERYVPMSQAETYEEGLAEGERRGIEKAIATLTGLTVYRSAAEFLQRNLDLLPRPEGDAPEKEGG